MKIKWKIRVPNKKRKQYLLLICYLDNIGIAAVIAIQMLCGSFFHFPHSKMLQENKRIKKNDVIISFFIKFYCYLNI